MTETIHEFLFWRLPDKSKIEIWKKNFEELEFPNEEGVPMTAVEGAPNLDKEKESQVSEV